MKIYIFLLLLFVSSYSYSSLYECDYYDNSKKQYNKKYEDLVSQFNSIAICNNEIDEDVWDLSSIYEYEQVNLFTKTKLYKTIDNGNVEWDAVRKEGDNIVELNYMCLNTNDCSHYSNSNFVLVDGVSIGVFTLLAVGLDELFLSSGSSLNTLKRGVENVDVDIQYILLKHDDLSGLVYSIGIEVFNRRYNFTVDLTPKGGVKFIGFYTIVVD
ncbi:MAG: hypothetical protein HRU38_13680 [Saccharospirillaceae bacterium]|nr:hypothetical protein [Pseudomonadales bacterium]NRB79695.1 hypothetical protein [Saccharospirillaceae bacterium]